MKRVSECCVHSPRVRWCRPRARPLHVLDIKLEQLPKQLLRRLLELRSVRVSLNPDGGNEVMSISSAPSSTSRPGAGERSRVAPSDGDKYKRWISRSCPRSSQVRGERYGVTPCRPVLHLAVCRRLDHAIR